MKRKVCLFLLLITLTSLNAFGSRQGVPTEVIVKGSIEPGQETQVTAIRFERDSLWKPIPFSVNRSYTLTVNRPEMLPSGAYILNYRGSVYKIDLKGGSLTVPLAKIDLAEYAKGARLFRDLTQSMENSKRALEAYVAKPGTFGFEKICVTMTQAYNQNLCQAFKEKNPMYLIGTLIKFDPEAHFLTYDPVLGERPELLYNWGRLYVGDSTLEKSVSVLPGVYGVEFEDQTGSKKFKFGITAP
ncbi:MAG: hypothetical protein IT289_10900 [Oligoflexia bacterium]|nr:hypothetical protein [Oligoflexia bacterium]